MNELEQTDNHVQTSTTGSVNPKPEAVTGRIMPPSAATPDDEPKAERKQPPQVTGHGIGAHHDTANITPAVPSPDHKTR